MKRVTVWKLIHCLYFPGIIKIKSKRMKWNMGACKSNYVELIYFLIVFPPNIFYGNKNIKALYNLLNLLKIIVQLCIIYIFNFLYNYT